MPRYIKRTSLLDVQIRDVYLVDESCIHRSDDFVVSTSDDVIFDARLGYRTLIKGDDYRAPRKDIGISLTAERINRRVDGGSGFVA